MRRDDDRIDSYDGRYRYDDRYRDGGRYDRWDAVRRDDRYAHAGPWDKRPDQCGLERERECESRARSRYDYGEDHDYAPHRRERSPLRWSRDDFGPYRRERSPPRRPRPGASSPRRVSPPRERQQAQTDWDCLKCGAFNFARRIACYQCQAQDDTSKAPRTEAPHGNEKAKEKTPTPVLYCHNIPSDATEDELAVKVASVLDSKFIRSIQIPIDKETGQRKGFAFVDCTTVENAKLVKEALNGSPLRDDRANCALSIDFSTSNRSSKAAAASSAAQVAILQATAASAMTTEEQKSPEYVYDEATGYYRHTSTGVLYDRVTGLFFNSATNAWYSWNEKTQEYSIVGSAPGASSASASARATQQTQTEVLEPKRQVVAVVAAAPTSSPVVMNLQTKYRDRAKERRRLHGDSALDELDKQTTKVRGRITGGKIRANRGRE